MILQGQRYKLLDTQHSHMLADSRRTRRENIFIHFAGCLCEFSCLGNGSLTGLKYADQRPIIVNQ